MSELLIRNGSVVFEDKCSKADIRVIDEKIVEINERLKKKSTHAKEIDAKGLHILPGGIDPHVHLSLPDYVPEEFRWADDFESGSKAALAGGITTLGCISVPDREEPPLGTIKRETASIQKNALADFIIHPVLFGPTQEKIQQIPQLAKEGCSTIKIFMVTDDFDSNKEAYFKAMLEAKKANMLTMIHCEDHATIKATCKKLVAEGKESLKYYAESRTVESEEIATKEAADFARENNVPIYVVHLSSKKALEVCRKAQDAKAPVFVEGRPIFLYLTEEMYQKSDGALYVVQPPLRTQTDIESLWKGIESGVIQTLATDHAPHTREQKLNPKLTIEKLVPGINELQVMLPMFHQKAVLERKLSLLKFAALTATNAAKLFGLYPRKGTIKIGSDADLVLWDLSEERIIDGSKMYSKAGFSIYEGEKITGWPKVTIRRGEVVFENGKITTQPGSGVVIERKRISNGIIFG